MWQKELHARSAEQEAANERAAIKRQFTEPYGAFGDTVLDHELGETPHHYRARLLAGLPVQEGTTIEAFLVLDEKSLRSLAAEWCAKAPHVAAERAIKAGTLQAIERHDAAGRLVREYVGDPNAWMSQFKSLVMTVERFYPLGRDRKWLPGRYETKAEAAARTKT